MKTILFLAYTLTITNSFAQNYTLGLPNPEKKLAIGETLIINLPNHMDGRFISSVELDELKSFFKSKPEYSFRLDVHIFGGSPEFCLDYSIFLSKDLRKILNSEHITIKGKGNQYPIFQDDKTVKYFMLNTRIEITVLETTPDTKQIPFPQPRPLP